ncbi:aminotransferase [Affinibrenneria salicis]|uniref:Aminotransferase n=1 Tax=Affinibrenneria salicis TaxID=2590031 RepID=A0A5J5FX84_9GAMM|nr:aminotransferase [Affinibrenneria salicis]KAA8998429.1 aminotransferase [Affinibrenneria salicis]
MQQNTSHMPDTELESLHQQDKAHFIHPFTDFSQFGAKGCDVIAKSEGIYVEDGKGNRFIDGIAGLWCVNVGHGRREIGEAMSRQAVEMAYYSPFNNLTNIPATRLAARLAQLAPGDLNHVFYSCGGSTANDATVRMVHFYFNQRGLPNKKKIIARTSGYHGTTYISATLTGTEGNNLGFDVVDEMVTHISEANCYRKPAGMDDAQYCDFLVDEFGTTIGKLGAGNVAAFIAEPIMGAGGVLMAPEGYHRRILDLCHENDILYISDEVVTAFGRLGHFFASEAVFGIQPDIINIAKGLTSGYSPLGATLISDKIYQVISKPQAKGAVFSTGFTYSGHPVSCAAALANLEIMDREKICEHVREVGPYLLQALRQRLSHHPIIGDIRGSHFMVGIESVANRDSRELLPAEAKVGYRIADACQKRGLIVRPIAHLNVISPPLIWTRDVIDEVVGILDGAFDETVESLKKDGFI